MDRKKKSQTVEIGAPVLVPNSGTNRINERSDLVPLSPRLIPRNEPPPEQEKSFFGTRTNSTKELKRILSPRKLAKQPPPPGPLNSPTSPPTSPISYLPSSPPPVPPTRLPPTTSPAAPTSPTQSPRIPPPHSVSPRSTSNPRPIVPPRKATVSPRDTPLSPSKTPLSPSKTPLSPSNTPLSPSNTPLSPRKTPLSPRSSNNYPPYPPPKPSSSFSSSANESPPSQKSLPPIRPSRSSTHSSRLTANHTNNPSSFLPPAAASASLSPSSSPSVFDTPSVSSSSSSSSISSLSSPRGLSSASFSSQSSSPAPTLVRRSKTFKYVKDSLNTTSDSSSIPSTMSSPREGNKVVTGEGQTGNGHLHYLQRTLSPPPSWSPSSSQSSSGSKEKLWPKKPPPSPRSSGSFSPSPSSLSPPVSSSSFDFPKTSSSFDRPKKTPIIVHQSPEQSPLSPCSSPLPVPPPSLPELKPRPKRKSLQTALSPASSPPSSPPSSPSDSSSSPHPSPTPSSFSSSSPTSTPPIAPRRKGVHSTSLSPLTSPHNRGSAKLSPVMPRLSKEIRAHAPRSLAPRSFSPCSSPSSSPSTPPASFSSSSSGSPTRPPRPSRSSSSSSSCIPFPGCNFKGEKGDVAMASALVWVNELFALYGQCHISNLLLDFRDGERVKTLASIVSQHPPSSPTPILPPPSSSISPDSAQGIIENALNELNSSGVDTTDITAIDIVGSSQRAILSLLWEIMKCLFSRPEISCKDKFQEKSKLVWAMGEGIKNAWTGHYSQFSISAFDLSVEKTLILSPEQIKVIVFGPNGKSVQGSARRNSQGQVVIGYFPSICGTHTIHASWGAHSAQAVVEATTNRELPEPQATKNSLRLSPRQKRLQERGEGRGGGGKKKYTTDELLSEVVSNDYLYSVCVVQ